TAAAAFGSSLPVSGAGVSAVAGSCVTSSGTASVVTGEESSFAAAASPSVLSSCGLPGWSAAGAAALSCISSLAGVSSWHWPDGADEQAASLLRAGGVGGGAGGALLSSSILENGLASFAAAGSERPWPGRRCECDGTWLA